jgi:hypothetical protein
MLRALRVEDWKKLAVNPERAYLFSTFARISSSVIFCFESDALSSARAVAPLKRRGNRVIRISVARIINFSFLNGLPVRIQNQTHTGFRMIMHPEKVVNPFSDCLFLLIVVADMVDSGREG